MVTASLSDDEDGRWTTELLDDYLGLILEGLLLGDLGVHYKYIIKRQLKAQNAQAPNGVSRT